VASVLTQEKGVVQKLAEWAQLKADMYDGFPFRSKLWNSKTKLAQPL